MPPAETPVPELVAPEMKPPDSTFSTPPSRTPIMLSVVPATLKMPPLDTLR